MDFAFTPEQEAARQEYEQFFATEEKRAPDGWCEAIDSPASDEFWAYHSSMAQKLGARGWLSLPWPKKYGGRELSQVDQLIFSEVMGYYRAPGVDQGALMVAPAIIEFGSEEMKKTWLPGIASGKTSWCQGWSEPNAGSDLASLMTSAVEDGDDFVINGRKIWTSAAHRASHMFVVARTNPSVAKHKGLTYFVTEMNRPGIAVSSLLGMDKAHHYNEVTFDNVRIPKANIVGAVNQGWNVTMAGTNFERTLILVAGNVRRELEELVEFCKQTGPNGKSLAKDPLVRNRLAQATIEVEVARRWAYYVAWLQSKQRPMIAEVSASKYFISESAVRLYNMGVEILGLYGTLKHGSKGAMLRGLFEHNCQSLLGWTILGGTSEVQKNLIAQWGLKLPRA